ncbi:hypothetical protein TRVL_07597 [Trypanosoma vivax]|nr:hypothetical protein TRVL_07597 [Trypanosoma vivax]
MPRGFGFGREPRRQGNLDGGSVGTKNAHDEAFRRICKETRPGDVGGGRAAFCCEFEPGEKQRRAVRKGAFIADEGWEDAGPDVSAGPPEGSSGKFHNAGAANDAAGAGPRLKCVWVREGPRCYATRAGRGESLGRSRVAAEGKLYRAPVRP